MKNKYYKKATAQRWPDEKQGDLFKTLRLPQAWQNIPLPARNKCAGTCLLRQSCLPCARLSVRSDAAVPGLAMDTNIKAELFSKVRSGQVRILPGSTPKLGSGTNIQDRLVALHHLDAPWGKIKRYRQNQNV